jgi:hypothetical protein
MLDILGMAWSCSDPFPVVHPIVDCRSYVYEVQGFCIRVGSAAYFPIFLLWGNPKSWSRVA